MKRKRKERWVEGGEHPKPQSGLIHSPRLALLSLQTERLGLG